MTRFTRSGLQLLAAAACALLLLVLAALDGAARAAEGPPLTRIAFGSCAHQDKPQPIWGAVLDYRPELFVFAGDNVYGDLAPGAPTPTGGGLRQDSDDPGLPGACGRACRCSRPGTTTTTAATTPAATSPNARRRKALFLDFCRSRPTIRGASARASTTPRPSGRRGAAAGDPARHAELPLAADPHRSSGARPARSATCPIPIRSRPCSARPNGPGCGSNSRSRRRCA